MSCARSLPAKPRTKSLVAAEHEAVERKITRRGPPRSPSSGDIALAFHLPSDSKFARVALAPVGP